MATSLIVDAVAPVYLRRAELNAMMTRELQKIAGCEGSTLSAGPQILVADFDRSNWASFTVTPAHDSIGRVVLAVADLVAAQTRELYNVVD